MPWLLQLFTAYEAAGRSLLPALQDLFIAPCFRNSETAGYTISASGTNGRVEFFRKTII